MESDISLQLRQMILSKCNGLKYLQTHKYRPTNSNPMDPTANITWTPHGS